MNIYDSTATYIISISTSNKRWLRKYTDGNTNVSFNLKQNVCFCFYNKLFFVFIYKNYKKKEEINFLATEIHDNTFFGTALFYLTFCSFGIYIYNKN